MFFISVSVKVRVHAFVKKGTGSVILGRIIQHSARSHLYLPESGAGTHFAVPGLGTHVLMMRVPGI